MTGYKVCRFGELIKGDRFLDPMSGAVVRADAVGPDEAGVLTIEMVTIGSQARAKLRLHPRRWMRRQFREGESA